MAQNRAEDGTPMDPHALSMIIDGVTYSAIPERTDHNMLICVDNPQLATLREKLDEKL